MEPLQPTPPPIATDRGGGLRRTVATAALALGLLVVGGTAVVMAASPEPSAGGVPTATDGATDPAIDPAPRQRGSDGTKPDCPEGAGPTDDDGTTDDGTTDDGTTETTPSPDPTTEPTPDPTETPTEVPSPTATPAV